MTEAGYNCNRKQLRNKLVITDKLLRPILPGPEPGGAAATARVGPDVGGEAERVSRGREAPVLRVELRAGTPARQVSGALHHGACAAIFRGGGGQGQDAR